MKRTPLKRKTYLKRSGSLKRAPLARVGKKKRVELNETSKERAHYVKRVWLCECCHKREATDCHEIVGGASRQLAVKERCCWLAICRRCHDDIHHNHKEHWPLARQLAAKKYADPEFYNRSRVLEIKGLADSAVTEEEVAGWESQKT